MPPAQQGRRGGRSRTGQDGFDLAVESSARSRRRDSGPRWPWPVVCILCCLLGVVGVWVLLTGLLVPEWLGQPRRGSFGSLVSGSTRLWLLAQGVPFAALGLKVTLVPLGLTLLLVGVSAETCRYATRAMVAARSSAGRPVSARNAYQVAILHAMVHLTAVLVAAVAAGSGQWGRAALGGLVVGLLPALVGALAAIRRPVAGWLPGPVRDLCAGAAAGCAVAVAGGAVALMAGLVGNAARLIELHGSLGAGVWGGVMLIIMQLAWLPDLMVWWSSWTLGPGFRIGAATSVSPFGVHLGVVPSFPVLAALPSGGEPGGLARLWMLVPVLAGVVAALVTSRRLTSGGSGRHRSTVSTLVMTTAAGLSGGVFLGVLGALSGGGIGPGRLAVVGPVMPAMAGMALLLLGGASLMTGGVVAALDWRRNRVASPSGVAGGADRTVEEEAAEATVKVSARPHTKRSQPDR